MSSSNSFSNQLNFTLGANYDSNRFIESLITKLWHVHAFFSLLLVSSYFMCNRCPFALNSHPIDGKYSIKNPRYGMICQSKINIHIVVMTTMQNHDCSANAFVNAFLARVRQLMLLQTKYQLPIYRIYCLFPSFWRIKWLIF